MSRKERSAGSFASGLTLVESRDDIPDALLEMEAECSALKRDLAVIIGAKPELAEALTLLSARQQLILDQMVACRRAL